MSKIKMLFSGLSKVFWNFLVFAIIQTVFFHTVVSEFAFKIIDKKVYDVSTLVIPFLPKSYLTNLQASIQQSLEDSSQQAEQSKKERNFYNLQFLIKTIGPLILGGLLAFAITFGSFCASGTISTVDSAVFSVILLSYATEAALFFIMMNRYEYIGTSEILQLVNDKLRPVTPSTMQS